MFSAAFIPRDVNKDLGDRPPMNYPRRFRSTLPRRFITGNLTRIARLLPTFQSAPSSLPSKWNGDDFCSSPLIFFLVFLVLLCGCVLIVLRFLAVAG